MGNCSQGHGTVYPNMVQRIIPERKNSETMTLQVIVKNDTPADAGMSWEDSDNKKIQRHLDTKEILSPGAVKLRNHQNGNY